MNQPNKLFNSAFSNTYNLGWRNHPNLSWRNAKNSNFGQGGQTSSSSQYSNLMGQGSYGQQSNPPVYPPHAHQPPTQNVYQLPPKRSLEYRLSFRASKHRGPKISKPSGIYTLNFLSWPQLWGVGGVTTRVGQIPNKTTSQPLRSTQRSHTRHTLRTS